MDIYKVILTSKDKNVFEFSTEASCLLDAEVKSFRRISENNWEHHQYKVKEIVVQNSQKELNV